MTIYQPLYGGKEIELGHGEYLRYCGKKIAVPFVV